MIKIVMHRLFLAIAFLTFFPLTAFAQLQIEGTECSQAPANFTAIITNNQDVDDVFGITAGGGNRGWVTFDQAFIKLGPGETGQIKFKIHPPKKTSSGRYDFPIYIYSTTNPNLKWQQNICVFVFAHYGAIIEELNFPSKLDPGKEFELVVSIKNIGTRDLADIRLTASLADLTKSKKITYLRVEEKKAVEFTFALDKYASPGKYSIHTSLHALGKVLDSRIDHFDVNEISKLDKEVRSRFGFVADFKEIEIKNTGNVEIRREIEVEIRKPWNLLIKAQGEPRIYQTEKNVVYVWSVDLKPGESAVIKFRFEYWPLLLFAIALAGAFY
jgi:hypothetical protein